MPISPLLCLKFENCQYCWQKATNSRLFSSTVAWGRLARVLHCLYLGRRHFAPGAAVSMVNPRLAPGSLAQNQQHSGIRPCWFQWCTCHGSSVMTLTWSGTSITQWLGPTPRSYDVKQLEHVVFIRMYLYSCIVTYIYINTDIQTHTWIHTQICTPTHSYSVSSIPCSQKTR